MTEQRVNEIVASLAKLTPEELDVVTDKVIRKRNKLIEAKKQEFLNRMTELIIEAREKRICFYHCDDELYEHNISVTHVE